MKTTERGFEYFEFTDYNGVECKIQISSLATEDAIWFGPTEIGLQEFVAGRNPAWQKVELEQSHTHHYVANSPMHLTCEQVAEILPILQKFVERGELE